MYPQLGFTFFIVHFCATRILLWFRANSPPKLEQRFPSAAVMNLQDIVNTGKLENVITNLLQRIDQQDEVIRQLQVDMAERGTTRALKVWK